MQQSLGKFLEPEIACREFVWKSVKPLGEVQGIVFSWKTHTKTLPISIRYRKITFAIIKIATGDFKTIYLAVREVQ